MNISITLPEKNTVDKGLEGLGLETYDGCGPALAESVLTEFGKDVLYEAIGLLPEDEVKEAVYLTLYRQAIAL